MTALTILAAVAAIIVAVIAIWNTPPVTRQRAGLQIVIREHRQLAKQAEGLASEPALIEFEDRFDEMVTTYETKQIPRDLADLWSRVFRLAGGSPVGRPFWYGRLVVHRDMNAMTVRRGSHSITGQDRLDPHRIPPPPLSAVKPSCSPIPVIKD